MKHHEMKIEKDNCFRGNCFKFLAACFQEPDREMFLQINLCENLVCLLSACGNASAAQAAREMLIALSEQNDEELKVEYSKLFVGPFEFVAPPYGSLFVEVTDRLLDESVIAVKKQYRKSSGLSFKASEASDHIAFELDFMHYLCFRETQAMKNDDSSEIIYINKMQSEFMDRSLGPWIAKFCEKIRKETENHFYFHLAECLEAFYRKTTFFFMSKAGLDWHQTEDSYASRAYA